MGLTDKNNVKKIQAGLALLILSVIIVGAAVASSTKKSTTTMQASPTSAHISTTSTTPTTTTSASSATTSSSSPYKDGTYKTTGSYNSPGGKESIGVTLTLSSGKVTAATVVSEANDPTAASYQTSFISGYKSYVIGKDITAIKVSSVSGSSLTSQGFNSAVQKIEQQAKA